MALVTSWSTATIKESYPFDSGRSVMKSMVTVENGSASVTLRSDSDQAKAITNAMTKAMIGIYCVGVITRAMTIRLYAQ